MWEENGVASYSLNVAYLSHCVWGEGRGRQWSGVPEGRNRVSTAGSLMVWCVLQSEKHGSFESSQWQKIFTVEGLFKNDYKLFF